MPTPDAGRKLFGKFHFWSCARRCRLINVRPLLRQYLDGALAQLGERLHGMQEVRGSTPLGSTKSQKMVRAPEFFLFGSRIFLWDRSGLKYSVQQMAGVSPELPLVSSAPFAHAVGQKPRIPDVPWRFTDGRAADKTAFRSRGYCSSRRSSLLRHAYPCDATQLSETVIHEGQFCRTSNCLFRCDQNRSLRSCRGEHALRFLEGLVRE